MTSCIHLLEGTTLDAAVFESLGHEVRGDGTTYVASLEGDVIAIVGDPSISAYVRSPSREWAVGGELIEDNKIAIWFEKGKWHALCDKQHATGPTPLVAGMRALCLAGKAIQRGAS
jgi:hypothetical protein